LDTLLLHTIAVDETSLLHTEVDETALLHTIAVDEIALLQTISVDEISLLHSIAVDETSPSAKTNAATRRMFRYNLYSSRKVKMHYSLFIVMMPVRARLL
jgi:hypothetical protein